MSRGRAAAFEILFALGALASAWPLFVARYVPIQDLPQHAAAVRVLHDFHTPAFGFQRYFELQLGSTQYLGVYLLADLLSYVFDVVVATKLVLAAALVGLPYAMRALLTALGRPPVYALFTLPLGFSTQVLLGFLNFALGLPLMLWGLALSVRFARSSEQRSSGLRSSGLRSSAPRLWLGLTLALVSTACFFAHVVPYGVLLIGSLLLAATPNARTSPGVGEPNARGSGVGEPNVRGSGDGEPNVRGSGDGEPNVRDRPAVGESVARTSELLVACFVPSLAFALSWLITSPAGHALSQLSQSGRLLTPIPPFGERLQELSLWLTDVSFGNEDERALWGAGALATCLILVAVFRPREAAPELVVRLALLCGLAWVGYFVLPSGFGFIWPINARFASLGCLLLVPLLPSVGARFETLVAACLLALSLHASWALGSAFRQSAETEYAGLASLVQRLPFAGRVVGLVFGPYSRFVRFSPFLHAAAWAQAERGGAVMFTFADFPSSPFRFREDNRPPRVPPRWEWLPSRVDTERDLTFYDHAITRNARSSLPGFRLLARDGAWALWSRQL
ncbi:MAG: hypothetical protein QM756_19220 [Polyangiaceae bacterium]